jgi:hypothetical protein
MKSGRMRWLMIVARIEEKRKVHSVLVGKCKIKNPLGRRRSIREDNIKIDIKETR